MEENIIVEKGIVTVETTIPATVTTETFEVDTFKADLEFQIEGQTKVVADVQTVLDTEKDKLQKLQDKLAQVA